MKKNQPFKMPTPVTIMGRSSSITNSFVNGIIPCIEPNPEEIKKALDVLKMSETDVRCAYCGDVATEWDHLNPLIKDKKPTGYISEIHNLVPACGKCNQSKGNSNWEQWMRGNADLSPTTRGIKDIDERIERLKDYEREFKPRIYDFEEIVGKTDWDNYWKELDDVIDVMKKAQSASDIIKKKIRQEVEQKKHFSRDEGRTDPTDGTDIKKLESNNDYLDKLQQAIKKGTLPPKETPTPLDNQEFKDCLKDLTPINEDNLKPNAQDAYRSSINRHLDDVFFRHGITDSRGTPISIFDCDNLLGLIGVFKDLVQKNTDEAKTALDDTNRAVVNSLRIYIKFMLLKNNIII